MVTSIWYLVLKHKFYLNININIITLLRLLHSLHPAFPFYVKEATAPPGHFWIAGTLLGEMQSKILHFQKWMKFSRSNYITLDMVIYQIMPSSWVEIINLPQKLELLYSGISFLTFNFWPSNLILNIYLKQTCFKSHFINGLCFKYVS